MAEMNRTGYWKLASTHLNKNYSDDPLCLQSFIDSINALEVMAETSELKKILFTFLLTRLDGKARELVTSDVTTVEDLKAILQKKIKPENSDVISGRMLNAKLNMSQSDDFSKKVEELADAFRRTLINERSAPLFANKMTIEKTIDVCVKNTRSDRIKSVLESTPFEAPKDVVTQILSFQSHSHRGRGNFRGNTNRYFNDRSNQNRNGRNPNDYSNNYGNSGSYVPRGRGRGNFRGQRGFYNGGYNNNNGYNGRGCGRGGQQNSNSNVRVFSNSEQSLPQTSKMGAGNVK